MWGRPFWLPALGTLVSFNKFYCTAVSMANWTAKNKDHFSPDRSTNNEGITFLSAILCHGRRAVVQVDCSPCYASAERQQHCCLPVGLRSRDKSRWLMLQDSLEYLWWHWLWAAGDPGTRAESSTKYPHQPQLWRLPALLCGLLPFCSLNLNFAEFPEPQQSASSSSRRVQNKGWKKAHASGFCNLMLAVLPMDMLHSSHSFFCWPCQILIILFAYVPSSQTLHLLFPFLKRLHLFKGFGCLPVCSLSSQFPQLCLRKASGFPKGWFLQLFFRT